MELIDKKLSEKLKLFEYIDKKYGTNLDESSSKRRATKNYAINNNFNNNENFFSNDIYDKIYSDFKSNSFKTYYSPLTNTFDLSKTKQNNRKETKYSKKNLNLSRDRELITENLTQKSKSRTNKPKKNLKMLYPPNDSGNRLYNYGYYIKNKLNKKRELEEEKIRKQMTPKILNRSKEMNRDPNKFEERLYYAEKNDTNDSIYNRRRTLSRENIHYNSKFTYHPKINKKSLLIASKLEPSTLRINKKKMHYCSLVEEKTVIDYYTNLFKDKNTTKKYKTNSNISPSCGREKSNELYLKGLQDIKKKEQTFNENQQKKEEEYKNYSYRPTINGKNKKKKISIDEIYRKNKEWKKRVDNENKTKKKKYEEIENKKYTFKPEINQLNLENDVNMIMKNMDQMYDYVTKRRNFLEQKKEEEFYKNKKLGLNAKYYNVKTTIPMEFDLKTEKRSKSNRKERDLNILNRQKMKGNKIITQAVILANNIKVKNKNGYLINEDSKCNFSKGKGNKTNYSITQSQKEFLKAVNDLHNNIDRLNI